MFPQAAPGGTGEVLTTPSSIDREIALKAVDQVAFDVVCRDAGVIAAREFANVLDLYALKPADYADQTDVPKEVLSKLLKNLADSDAFWRAFVDTLRMRG
jgi:hypothetical protein